MLYLCDRLIVAVRLNAQCDGTLDFQIHKPIGVKVLLPCLQYPHTWRNAVNISKINVQRNLEEARSEGCKSQMILEDA